MIAVSEVLRNHASAAGAGDWLEALPELLARLERQWGVTVGRPFTGASEAYVAEATTTDGRPVVLKVLLPLREGEARHEIGALRLAGGRGMVALLRDDPAAGALLLPRLGPPLHALGLPTATRHDVLCDTVARVWRPAPGSGLPTGADRARRLTTSITTAWEALGRPCSERALDHALRCARRREAAHDDERAVLVHGDVHQLNALQDGRRFTLVDPDGLLAEPECDLGTVMRGDPVDLLHGDPHERARRLAARTGLDPVAVWEWGVIERVASGLHCTALELQPLGRQTLRAAEAAAEHDRTTGGLRSGSAGSHAGPAPRDGITRLPLVTQTSPTILDPRGADLVPAGATLERLGTGSTWAEGPVWLPGENALLFSDIPGDRIMRWDESAGTETSGGGGLTVHREGVEFTNGRTLDREGRVVACSHGRRAMERTEPDGTTTILVDRFGDKRFNSPNDVVVASDGAVWFTDPPYGITVAIEGHEGFREYGDNFVFRFDPATGDLRVVVTDVEEPNGLAFSPDESLLYVADTSAAPTPGNGDHRLIRVYDVLTGITGGRGPQAVPGGPVVKNGRVFVEVDRGLADGFRVDTAGNVWTSNGDAVTVFAPDGTRLLEVVVGEVVANVCFGGADGTDLFVAASSSAYRLRTNAVGAGLWWL